MKVKQEKFLTLDSEITATVEVLASAINSMDSLQISKASKASDKLKEVLSKNYVRRHHYTSLHRSGVQKNKLLDSFIVRHLLINASVNALTSGIRARPTDESATELCSAIENRKTSYDDIENIAEAVANFGKYQQLLNILLDIGNRYSLNQSTHITYFLTRQCYKVNKQEHSRLIEDAIDRLDILEIKPKSPAHIYRQVLLIGTDGDSKGDLDLVVLSDCGLWYIIEAKTGKKKNAGRMRHKARRCLRHHYDFLSRELGISPELTCVYRANGSNKFKWFRYEKPA